MNFALIGYPLGHSFSKKYFSEKFETLHLSLAYEACPMENVDGIRNWVAENPALKGFNITIPHKINILPYLDQLSDEATAIGAVNCVKITRTNSKIHLTGHNTDAYGFKFALLKHLKSEHKKALVLGNGGAAKAVCFVLQELGIEFKIVSRTSSAHTISYADIDKELFQEHLLLINTSPLGTFPNTEECPNIPYEFLTPRHLLYDLIYNPAETLFLKKGKAQGADTLNGYEMLVQQAERSWEIWNT